MTAFKLLPRGNLLSSRHDRTEGGKHSRRTDNGHSEHTRSTGPRGRVTSMGAASRFVIVQSDPLRARLLVVGQKLRQRMMERIVRSGAGGLHLHDRLLPASLQVRGSRAFFYPRSLRAVRLVDPLPEVLCPVIQDGLNLVNPKQQFVNESLARHRMLMKDASHAGKTY
jgi:hypothetical protein